jgi:UDP-N-acetylglucosamine--N-acetylmuramyl-(pentapeptide) pyrophosphoryl-undecaprenol N-acetylglucosamine transferase
MTFLIASAGTGGHVFPGLAVGEALVANGVTKSEVSFVGGNRLESRIFPQSGYPFVELDLRGLRRSLSLENLALPMVVLRATTAIAREINRRRIGVALGMGGYVTVPTGLAARRESIPLMLSEQNARAGLANRIAARWSDRRFSSFPNTKGLAGAEWVGNPIRSSLARFDRASLRPEALARFNLSGSQQVLGVFGGSLGAGAINTAVARMANTWSDSPFQILHLTGDVHDHEMQHQTSSKSVTWRRIAFEDRMDLFYAASDLVITRAGGAVAELTATGTPAVLVPGEFGSSGHQNANAGFLVDAGAALLLREGELSGLPDLITDLLFDDKRLSELAGAAQSIALPDAAETIARAMIAAVA